MEKLKKVVKNPGMVVAAFWLFQVVWMPKLPTVYAIIISTAICAVLLVLVWLIHENVSVYAKVTATVSVLLFAFLPILLSDKQWILFSMIWLVVLALTDLILRRTVCKGQPKSKIFLLQYLYVFLWLVTEMDYVFPGLSELWLHLIILFVAVIVGVLYVKKELIILTPDKETIFRVLLCVALVYSVLTVYVQQLNFALDIREPTQYEAVITGKNLPKIRINEKKDSGVSRYFQLEVNGESIDVRVSHNVYRSRDVGDTFSVYRYEGAFGIPFYLKYKK